MAKSNRLGFEQEPVLMVEVNTGECPRCKGATKIPNLQPGPHLIDCPTCEGTGRVEVYAPMTEADLDEAVALGIELAQLRRAKETSHKAACQIRDKFFEVGEALATVPATVDLIRARAIAREGFQEAAALIALLEDGGDQ